MFKRLKMYDDKTLGVIVDLIETDDDLQVIVTDSDAEACVGTKTYPKTLAHCYERAYAYALKCASPDSVVTTYGAN